MSVRPLHWRGPHPQTFPNPRADCERWDLKLSETRKVCVYGPNFYYAGYRTGVATKREYATLEEAQKMALYQALANLKAEIREREEMIVSLRIKILAGKTK